MIRTAARTASVVGAAGLLVVLVPPPAGADSQTFTADGTFTVPADVTSITIDAVGGAGGSCDDDLGGLGARVQATLSVTPGQEFTVTIGGMGGDFTAPTGGANGGGTGDDGGGGGGATDLRFGGTTLNDRVLVAGGGGGCIDLEPGGDGGHPTGGDGSGGEPGLGGTQSAGGEAGNNFTPDGVFGVGGDGDSFRGGAGGGGWYGGGGGGEESGGGGGSSYVAPSFASVSHGSASTRAAGSLTITWPEPAPSTTAPTTTPPTTVVVPGSDGDSLPETGASTTVWVVIGSMAAFGGVMLMIRTRRQLV